MHRLEIYIDKTYEYKLYQQMSNLRERMHRKD